MVVGYIVQYDNRRDTDLRLLMKYTEDYCLKHGYHYVCPNETYGLPTYWIKVLLVKQLLETVANDGDIVGWIDSDAVFVQTDVTLENIFGANSAELAAVSGGKDFITCLDPGSLTQMNSGVFFIRKTPQTVQLVRDWMACYKPENWTLGSDGKWKTEGRWAGPDYEQGSFNEQILPKYRPVIALHPEKRFACFSVLYDSETIVCHFMYTHKRKIGLYNVRRNLPEILFWLAVGGFAIYSRKLFRK